MHTISLFSLTVRCNSCFRKPLNYQLRMFLPKAVNNNMQPPQKKQKLDSDITDPSEIRNRREKFLATLSRGVSPPLSGSAKTTDSKSQDTPRANDGLLSANKDQRSVSNNASSPSSTSIAPTPPSHRTSARCNVVPSPIQLTRIRDLKASDNHDTISLADILGDPLISEAWVFNFCFDVDWLMQHFDSDTKDLVKVKIVHGSWRREDMNKLLIDEACSRMPNVDAIQAYLPDAFGTHHSKMFILFKHDDTAQVLIHTANMLDKDWANMTQAVWKSPVLPLSQATSDNEVGPIGSGSRFKADLLAYLKAYGSKLKPLVQKLAMYDFSSIKAALISSVPSKFKPTDEVVWGHEALRRVLVNVPHRSNSPHFVFQVSSIASLPAAWMKETLCRATGGTAGNTSIIFPTADDVRMSLDGYSAGASIHTKAQNDVHLDQISMLRPQLRRWTKGTRSESRRHLAAPHIKTYVRFAAEPSEDNPTPFIDWTLVTSANLSTQAWGSVAKSPKGSRDYRDAVIHIQSFEIGVLVWPELFSQAGLSEEGFPNTSLSKGSALMVPTFGTDVPSSTAGAETVVGFRMPYDLPLTPYTDHELPWSAQSPHNIADSQGLTWPPPGY